MTKIEAVSADVAETNAKQVSGVDVALTVHQRIVSREVDVNERPLLNLGCLMHHLRNRGLRCRGGLGDVIVVVNDVAGVDIAAHTTLSCREVAGSLPVLAPCMIDNEWIPFKALSL